VPNPCQSSSDEAFQLCGTSIPRGDGVCDYTLRANERKISWGIEESIEENVSAELPVIIVQDLVTGPRFRSYCRPGSVARFYAAVPIRSPRGINISVLCVINSVPGANWDETHSTILRGLSKTIMGHFRRQPS
jgi:GAF domain-containing protein